MHIKRILHIISEFKRECFACFLNLAQLYIPNLNIIIKVKF